MLSSERTWVALDADRHVMKIGMTVGQFSRHCFHFSFGGFCSWVVAGARYCEVLDAGWRGQDVNMRECGPAISTLKHGRIRCCEAALKFKQMEARDAFFVLWDSINGKKYPLENNDWVWGIEWELLP